MADFFHSPQAEQMLKNKEQIMAMMHSPEAQRLMQLIRKQSGSNLDGAAQSAAQGDPAKLMTLLQQVMATPEGAKAVENISRKLPK